MAKKGIFTKEFKRNFETFMMRMHRLFSYEYGGWAYFCVFWFVNCLIFYYLIPFVMFGIEFAFTSNGIPYDYIKSTQTFAYLLCLVWMAFRTAIKLPLFPR